VALELSPFVVRRVISELHAHDPESVDDVEGALEWISGREHETEPIVLTRYDLQLFLWYQLPRKWLTSLEHRRAVVDALARFLERADARATSHATLCRSEDTHELLSLWEHDGRDALRRFQELLEESGLEPRDTALLGWGDVMGPREADLRHGAALALEAAMEEGALRPGARDFKRQQAAVLKGFLSEPRADLDGRSPVEVIHEERLERWLEHGSPDRRALLEPVAEILRAPVSDPPYLPSKRRSSRCHGCCRRRARESALHKPARSTAHSSARPSNAIPTGGEPTSSARRTEKTRWARSWSSINWPALSVSSGGGDAGSC
jgi:hypothetical protein